MIDFDNISVIQKDSIDVSFFYQYAEKKFGFKLLAGEGGLDHKIKDQNLHRPGLALAGFVDLFSYTRIQVFGNTEIKYLAKLTANERYEALERIFKFEIPCIICTNGNQPFIELLELANKYNTPLMITEYTTTKFSNIVGDFLDDLFAPNITIHGSFVDVYGVGVLFIGKSGIGFGFFCNSRSKPNPCIAHSTAHYTVFRNKIIMHIT